MVSVNQHIKIPNLTLNKENKNNFLRDPTFENFCLLGLKVFWVFLSFCLFVFFLFLSLRIFIFLSVFLFHFLFSSFFSFLSFCLFIFWIFFYFCLFFFLLFYLFVFLSFFSFSILVICYSNIPNMSVFVISNVCIYKCAEHFIKI